MIQIVLVHQSEFQPDVMVRILVPVSQSSVTLSIANFARHLIHTIGTTLMADYFSVSVLNLSLPDMSVKDCLNTPLPKVERSRHRWYHSDLDYCIGDNATQSSPTAQRVSNVLDQAPAVPLPVRLRRPRNAEALETPYNLAEVAARGLLLLRARNAGSSCR